MSNSIRLGILSFAHLHAESYARCLQKINEVELVGIYDEDKDRGRQWAESFETDSFDKAETLLDRELDAVIICSENVRHRPLVELAAGQVGAILCEKPIATTIEDGQAIIDRCAESGTSLQIAFPVRFAHAILHLKETLDSGHLGRTYSVKCTNHGTMPGGWFVQKELSGGGAVLDHTVHVIDVLRWFWDTEITEVYAEVGNSLLHPGLDIDDAGLLSFQMDNGVFGTLDTSWSRPKGYPTWGDVKIDVLGENGVARVDAFRQRLEVYSEKTGKATWVNWGSDMNLGLIRDFVEMVQEGREPFITGVDGLKALEVALAAYESARTGKPVTLNRT